MKTTTMNKITLTLCTALVATAVSMNAWADDALHDKASHVSAGFLVGAVDDDFALGLQVTSPYVLSDRMALRVSGNMSFLEGIPEGDTMSTEMRYTSLRVGLVGVGGMLSKAIRIYGEGGVVALFPSSDFSDDNAIGGYGVFGFEFFMSSQRATPISYFIELGSQGVSARAEKLVGQPGYGSGMSLEAGLRFHI